MTTTQLAFDFEAVKPEEWRAVVGFEGLYEISNAGRVRSVARGTLIALVPNIKSGYIYASLSGGYRRTIQVHRLVAEAFLPRPPDCHHVNHKNFERSDNRVENFEWCTPAQNTAHSAAAGRFSGGHGILSESDIPVILARLAHGHSRKMIAADYGLRPQAIGKIARGERWRHLTRGSDGATRLS